MFYNEHEYSCTLTVKAGSKWVKCRNFLSLQLLFELMFDCSKMPEICYLRQIFTLNSFPKLCKTFFFANDLDRIIPDFLEA